MKDGMYLSGLAATLLFFWFLILGAGSCFILYGQLVAEGFSADTPNAFSSALKMSVLSATASSSIFYIRKLYKDLFAQAQKALGSSSSELATIMYFSARPLFAVLFSIFIVVSSFGFVHSVTVDGTKLSFGFVLFSMILSCLAAVVTGRTLNHIEKLARDGINRITGG
jgi:hypothetical protein